MPAGENAKIAIAGVHHGDGESSAYEIRFAKLKTGARNGWNYLEWPTCRVPMATVPEDLTRRLLEIGARALGG